MATLDVASDSTLQQTNTALQAIATAINNGGGGGGSSTLAGLNDTVITNPTNGQVLKYNSSTNKWINATDGSYVPTSDVLSTLAACIANTSTSKVASATALKELNTKVENISGGSGGRRTITNVTSLVSSLSSAVTDQNLERYGFSIGDYFVGNSGYKYYLADMDTFYGGYNKNAIVNTHHLALVVVTSANVQWSTSWATGWDYTTSNLKEVLESTIIANVRADFNRLFDSWQSHMVSHSVSVPYAEDGFEWVSNNYIVALTLAQVMGGHYYAYYFDVSQGEGYKELELFRKYHYSLIFGNTDVWLRNVDGESGALFLSSKGDVDGTSPNVNKRAVGLILFK